MGSGALLEAIEALRQFAALVSQRRDLGVGGDGALMVSLGASHVFYLL